MLLSQQGHRPRATSRPAQDPTVVVPEQATDDHIPPNQSFLTSHNISTTQQIISIVARHHNTEHDHLSQPRSALLQRALPPRGHRRLARSPTTPPIPAPLFTRSAPISTPRSIDDDDDDLFTSNPNHFSSQPDIDVTTVPSIP